jgi:ribonuclease H2 subunit A
MVYGVLYLPLAHHKSLLADQYHFDDSKVLTPEVRSLLLETLCKPDTDLYKSCGWATRVMSARDISAGMLKPAGSSNLNAQAMDATIELIREVLARRINVKEIYIDTIGSPTVYQSKLERIFPAISITVAKKADSLYPCVSAASVCAKVTRDAALEVSHGSYAEGYDHVAEGWGSGYPSDGRTTAWMKLEMDPFFGWGNVCRFSWSTAKDLLEVKEACMDVSWPEADNDISTRLTNYFGQSDNDNHNSNTELMSWYGGGLAETIL